MSEYDYSLDDDPVWAILNGMPSMVAYWDKNLRCRFANRAYERWFGRKGSSLFDTHLEDLLGPELFARNQPYIRAALAGQPQEFERLIPGPDGVLRPSLACYTPHVIVGTVRGFIAQVTEVTLLHEARTHLEKHVQECVKANQRLRKIEGELQLAQRLGEIGSWTWDVDEDIVVWSPQLYEIFGMDCNSPPPTLAQRDALYTHDSLALLRAQVQNAIEFGMPYVLDLQYVHRSGRLGWIEARGAALRDASGRVVRLHGTAQEVTARRSAQEGNIQALRIVELEHALLRERARVSTGLASRSNIDYPCHLGCPRLAGQVE